MIFDVTDFLRRSLSLQVPALRHLHFFELAFLGSLRSTLPLLCTGDESKNLYRCSEGDSRSLKYFHVVVFGCNFFRLGVFWELPFCGVILLPFCTPVQEKIIPSPHNFCQACYLAAIQILVHLMHTHAADSIRIRS